MHIDEMCGYTYPHILKDVDAYMSPMGHRREGPKGINTTFDQWNW